MGRTPRTELAACGRLDVGACVDAAEYSFYYGIARIGWAIDRTLLQLAYQLDQFRWCLIETAFATAYQIITNFVSPVYVPVATVALILASVLFMLALVTKASCPSPTSGARRLILAADLAEARRDSLLDASTLHLNEQQQVVYTERASYPTQRGRVRSWPIRFGRLKAIIVG
jgi:hypothetical protein